MYRLIINEQVFMLPKGSLKAFALSQALQRGITHGNIHDDITSIKYLKSIGIKVEEV